MFSSQTSSFQESLDVEDKDDFEDRISCYYTVYLYQGTRSEASVESVTWNQRRTDSTSSQEDFSLTLIDSSLPQEAEPELRSYISRRLSKGALLGGMSNIATVELSLPEQAVGCYCCLLEQQTSPEQPDSDGTGHVVCFLGGSEKGLNLYRLELDKYVQGLHSSLQTPENLESQLRPYLTQWFEESVMHVCRVVQLLQNQISFILHAALSHTRVEVVNSDERTKVDVSRFLRAAGLQGLTQQDSASLCTDVSEPHLDLVLDCSTCPPTLSPSVSNRFCEDWVTAFINAAERRNPFLLRQILDNFKLKAIQDMNSLKRLVRQAETSHYSLFRCHQFLQACGNGHVLLQNARAEHADMPESCRIIAVLEEFLRDQSSA